MAPGQPHPEDEQAPLGTPVAVGSVALSQAALLSTPAPKRP